MNPQLLIVSAIAITLVWWLITAGFLLLGSLIAGIRDRSFGRSLGIAVLSGIASFILGAGLGLLPGIAPVGGFLGFLFGILVAAFFLKVWSQATFGRALGAAALGYLLPLALVAFLGMVAAILIPALSKGLSNAAMTATVSNGANLYKSATSVPLTDPGQDPPWTAFPAKGRYRTSTEYFRDLVESGRMAVSYDFFSARGLPAAHSSRPEDFTADHNAWRVVLGLEDAPDGTPFLFTRNYNPETLETGDHPIELEDMPPFGKDGMVVILKGGAAFSLRGSQLNHANFNPAQTPSGPGIEIIGP
ncbi:MAG TPA: hypothetical protein PLK81_07195 [Kiritimatiellia bacterium]|nr:hypothetical protein [Kiritimatiellia bacterium]